MLKDDEHATERESLLLDYVNHRLSKEHGARLNQNSKAALFLNGCRELEATVSHQSFALFFY